MPKITLGITELPEILGRDYGIEKPFWEPRTKCTKRLIWSRPLDGSDRYHCYWRALGEAARSRLLLGSAVFCTIAGKSQNLFGWKNRSMRSRLFSYYQGYSILCDDITQNARGWDWEIPGCKQKRGDRYCYIYFPDVFICLWKLIRELIHQGLDPERFDESWREIYNMCMREIVSFEIP